MMHNSYLLKLFYYATTDILCDKVCDNARMTVVTTACISGFYVEGIVNMTLSHWG